MITETLTQSTLGSKRVGDRVNLERAMRTDDRFDGHFVQGHVDGMGRVSAVQSTAREWVVWIRPESHLRHLVIPKGSIAIDGVSLTVAELRGDEFAVALIPTTRERTTLGALASGMQVNIESDIIVRTIVHRMSALSADTGLSLETLREAGFA